MSKTRENQIKLLKNRILFPMLLGLLAWIVLFVVGFINASTNGIATSEYFIITVSMFFVLEILMLCLNLHLIKAYRTLKNISEDRTTVEKQISCLKIKFVRANRARNTSLLIGVILTDTKGIKYTYIFEEAQYNYKQIREPYIAYSGTTVTLVCYGDTPYVEHIRG